MATHYEHLSTKERAVIQLGLQQGFSLRQLAAGLDRSPSTISRELKRNGWSNPASHPKRRGRPLIAGGYRAVQAQCRADDLLRKPRTSCRLDPSGPLWNEVVRLLRDQHSPEQIAGILRRMNPDAPTMQVSHETIYTAIYALPRGELRSELVACLRHRHKTRRPRARGQDRRGKIPNMTSIHMRPPEIEERVIPGHWEGDLIKGARNASAVGTLVERTSIFVLLAKMADASADSAVSAFSTALNRVDAQVRISMTYDQGPEMAKHPQLAENTGIKVYFADPHSPWQRGLNENTNGLLRQYLPKGTDLSSYSQEDLDRIAWQLNTRPRKSLGWKCPAELFIPGFDFVQYYRSQSVALRT